MEGPGKNQSFCKCGTFICVTEMGGSPTPVPEQARYRESDACGKVDSMDESRGRFGIHGGQYIPETLMNAVIELEEAYTHYKRIRPFRRN